MRNYTMVFMGVLLLGGCSWFYAPPSRVDNPIVEGVNFVGITVSNLDQTEKLLADSTNTYIVENSVIEDHPLLNKIAGRNEVTAKARLMRNVNAQVLLMQFDNPSLEAKSSPFVDANGPGIAHLAFQVLDKTETYQKILQGGAKHIGSKHMVENPKTHVSYAYVRDPDNILIEIEHVDITPLNLPAPPKNERRIRHISLATTDMDRAISFYSVLLETENPRRIGKYFHLSGEETDDITGIAESEMEMAWFQVRNLELEIIQYHNPEAKALKAPRPIDANGYNMIVFDVADLNVAHDKLVAAGGTIVTDTHTWNGGEIFFGRDPDGNLLGFQNLPEDSPFSAKNFRNNGLE